MGSTPRCYVFQPLLCSSYTGWIGLPTLAQASPQAVPSACATPFPFTDALIILHELQSLHLTEANPSLGPGSHPLSPVQVLTPATFPMLSPQLPFLPLFQIIPINTHTRWSFVQCCKGYSPPAHGHPGYCSNKRWGTLFKGQLEQPHGGGGAWEREASYGHHISCAIKKSTCLSRAKMWSRV